MYMLSKFVRKATFSSVMLQKCLQGTRVMATQLLEDPASYSKASKMATLENCIVHAFQKENFLRGSKLIAEKGFIIIPKAFLSSEAEQQRTVQSSTVVEFPLPQPGEGIKECELLKWLVEEGDAVEEFQTICMVQSDKAAIEITSPYKGTVAKLRFLPGDMIMVGETLLEIETDGTIVSQIEGSRDSVNKGENEGHGKTLATPAVRHMAKEYGVKLEEISGSGKNGRILKEDILKWTKDEKGLDEVITPIVQENSTESLVYKDRIISLRGFQRAMVKSMSMAAKIPHFHYVEEVAVDSLMKLKNAFQNATSGQDLKHSYLPFLIKSLSVSLLEHPSMNSSFNEEAYELVCKGSHNIGVAMATEHGLVVPNIKNVQSLSILQITKELRRLLEAASKNTLSTEDTSGGTITLSNIGSIGGRFGSPLLNSPEVVIIALGRIQKLPRFNNDGSIYATSVVNVAFGADHRVIDGAAVARFSNTWKCLIENPEHVLLHLR